MCVCWGGGGRNGWWSGVVTIIQVEQCNAIILGTGALTLHEISCHLQVIRSHSIGDFAS